MIRNCTILASHHPSRSFWPLAVSPSYARVMIHNTTIGNKTSTIENRISYPSITHAWQIPPPPRFGRFFEAKGAAMEGACP